ncbi:MAG TPA: hypothetical protein ENK49_11215 [Gammaproteobacteria bacterium]|nr:hypothetical protein [Gammaproteobacteria bacterium]
MTDRAKTGSSDSKARLVLAVGVFDHEEKATRVIEKLIEEDFPADRLSLLRKTGGLGDDMLGLAYTNTAERVKAWGEHGAVWGALWGLLAGATGLFVLPGIGPLLAAGPVVEALGGAIAGAAVAGGGMAGAALLSELASALHRIGIPEADIELIHDAIEAGHYVVILHCDPDQADHCAMRLGWAGADPVTIMPVAR